MRGSLGEVETGILQVAEDLPLHLQLRRRHLDIQSVQLFPNQSLKLHHRGTSPDEQTCFSFLVSCALV